jgi:hypothetical protein
MDLIALGSGHDDGLFVVGGWIVSLAWRAADDVRAAFADPKAAELAVPAWRGAVLLSDPNGLAASLRDEAVTWSWDRCDDVERWAASELTGYAEEVIRLRGAIASGHGTLAAVMSAVIALHMARIVAAYRRMLLPSENELWDAVSEREGPEWTDAQRSALGLDAVAWGERALAALRLFALTVAVVDDALSDDHRTVIDRALHV